MADYAMLIFVGAIGLLIIYGLWSDWRAIRRERQLGDVLPDLMLISPAQELELEHWPVLDNSNLD